MTHVEHQVGMSYSVYVSPLKRLQEFQATNRDLSSLEVIIAVAFLDPEENLKNKQLVFEDDLYYYCFLETSKHYH